MGLWTPEHAYTLLPALAVMIIVGALLRALIGDKPLKTRMIPFQILAFAAFILEVGKQAVSFSRGYDLYHIPLHFCSIFIFILPIMAVYKGKGRGALTGLTAALCGSVTLLMLIYPSLIYSAWDITDILGDYMHFHTVVFHNIVMFEFVLILALDLHSPETKRDTKAIMIFMPCFCAAAAVMSQLLKTNYAGFYSCNVPFFESVRLSLRESIGAVPAQILYVFVIALLHILFVLMTYWVYRLLRRMITGAKSSEETNA